MLKAGALRSRLQLAAWVALLYGLISFNAGFKVATWLVSSGIAGYINSFVMLPMLIAAANGRRPSYLHVALSALALVASFFIVYFGYWILLALCTLSFLLVYLAVTFAD